MAKPDYYLCDICGEKASMSNHLYVWLGYDHDPAEEYVDLCDNHAASSVNHLLRDDNGNYNSALGKRLLEWVKGKRKEKAK